MSGERLRILSRAEIPDWVGSTLDEETERVVARIVSDVRDHGEEGLRRRAVEFGDIPAQNAPLLVDRAGLEAAALALEGDSLGLLERVAERVRAFARAQRAALSDVEHPVPGGLAGHEVVPVERAGCYAPGGRFPLPSSVLMTAAVARTAGVGEVWVASPRPSAVTLAAAFVAGADGLLVVGGAQAIAALAHGVGGVPACDVIVGPGNRWVTAAKKLLAGQVGIDMLAGPSELVVLADRSANPSLVAADLIAQAEHDPEASPVLVTVDAGLAQAVRGEVDAQLEGLVTRGTAEAALERGFVVLAEDWADAVAACDRLAPEHLEVMAELAPGCAMPSCYGARFDGELSAEVLGDYGAGPNHVLPTGGGARFGGGLSVLDFLRVRTWLRIRDREGAREVVEDAVALARLEGLEGHARAAERRR